MNFQKITLQLLKKIYNSPCDIMTKRNARYDILGRHFYDCFTLFRTNKNKLGLKTYKNDKILLDYITKETKFSREKLFN